MKPTNFSELFAIICLIIAGIMGFMNVQGWGWFLFVAAISLTG